MLQQVEALAKKMQQQAANMRRSLPEVPLTQVSVQPCHCHVQEWRHDDFVCTVTNENTFDLPIALVS